MPNSLRLVVLLLAGLIPASLVLTAPASAQAGQLKTASQQELDVIKVLLKQEAAWNRGDIDAFAEGYKDSSDTLFINNQVQRGYAGMLESYHRNYPNREAMGTLSFSELEVHPLDERFAVCIGKYHLDRNKKSGGNADGIFSLILEKTDKGWKIVVDHTT
jgi:ketosteroid isomerase-like protein